MLGIIKSFKPQTYRVFARQRVMRTIGFFLMFVLLVSTVVAYQSYTFVNDLLPYVGMWIEDNFDTIFSEMPLIEIEDGKILAPRELYVQNFNDVFVFIIEPETDNIYPILERYKNVIVLAQKKLLIQFTRDRGIEETQMKTYNLEKMHYFRLERMQEKDGVEVLFGDNRVLLTKDNVKATIEKVTTSVYPFFFIFFFFYYNGAKLIQVFLFSLVSLIMNEILRVGASYGEIFNIGVYALVPPTLMALVCSLLELHIPFFAFGYILVYGLFLFWALKAMKG